MKRRIALLLTVLMIFSITACGNETEVSPESESAPSETSSEQVDEVSDETVSDEAVSDEADGSNMLVAYFSYAENAALPDGVDASSTASIQAWNGETTGNTGVVAAMIAEATGADLFSIQTVDGPMSRKSTN